MNTLASKRPNVAVLPVFITFCLLLFADGLFAGDAIAETSVTPATPVIIAGLDEPLVAIGRADKPTSLRHPPQNTVFDSDIDRLQAFVRLNQNTSWEASLQLNLGLAYYRNGYFSEAFGAYERAWALSKYETSPAEKILADRAFGELIRMHARLGREEAVADLLESVQDREFTGPATEAVAGAHEALWTMRNDPGTAYLCGPKALQSLVPTLSSPLQQIPSVLAEYRSPAQGVSLNTLQKLADDANMSYRMVYRKTGGVIPVPSVVHWKVNHYAAIVAESEGLYHIKDPTFGDDLWLTADAINHETSNYFMVAENSIAGLGAEFGTVSNMEGDKIVGRGQTASSDASRTAPCDKKISNGECTKTTGMPVYDVHTMLVSLNITDTPIRYQPPKGPEVAFTLTYNQREANQPANFMFSNMGPKWTHNWLSYIEDSPTSNTAAVKRIVGGGGSMTYGGLNTVTGEYLSARQDSARLVRTSRTPIRYERRLPNGSIEVFAQSDGAASGIRRVFLTQKLDPQGHAVNLQYDDQLRLVNITDALSQVTTFHYQDADSFLIRSVTDPFGRVAAITYNDRGRLESITDPVGIASSFIYDNGDFITRMVTPYGQTSFRYAGNGTSRWLEITDPHGETERVEYGHALGISASVPDLPAGDVLTRNSYHNYRNTAYWDKQTYKQFGRNISKAEISHWLHTEAGQSSGMVETFKKPLENRIIYNYPGQTDAIHARNSTSEKPSRIARVLDDGSVQIHKYQYNSMGRKVYEEDPLGGYKKYVYAANQIDLIKIIQLRNGAEEVVAEYEWDDRHNMLSETDGLGHTTRYTYNSDGQRLTVTNALGQVTQYNYDGRGYLVKIIAPNGNIQRYEYDDVGRVSRYVDHEGHWKLFTYDGLNRLLTVRYADGTTLENTWSLLDLVKVTDRLGRETRYTYDALRRLVAETDAEGRETRYAYDASGRQLSVTDALGNTTYYEYDIQGRRTAMIDAEGNRTQYLYENTTSRLAKTLDSLNGETRYRYDKNDRLVAVVDPNGHETGYQFDAVGNTLAVISPDSGLTRYVYDVLSNRISETDARGITSAFEYDPLNRLTSVSYPESTSNILYSYDGNNYPDTIDDILRQTAVGQRTGLSDSTGITTWYFNTYGNLTQQDTQFNTLPDQLYSQKFHYDYSYEPGQGLLTDYRYPNGQLIHYTYDQYGRITDISSEFNGNEQPVVSQVVYHPVVTDGIKSFYYGNQLGYDRVVDELGRLATLTIGDREIRFHRTWSYTPNSNVAQIHDLVDAANDRRYGYDSLHRLTNVSRGAGDIAEYRYDANGNRLGVNSTDYVIADDSNRLTGTVSNDGTARIYDYDAAGNQNLSATDDEVIAYSYDQKGRLSQIASEVTTVAEYQYNGLGQRVYKSTATGTEYSLYGPDGKRIATLSGSGALLQNTLYWQQDPLARFEPVEETENVYRFETTSWLFWKPSASLDVWPENKTLSLKRYKGEVLSLQLSDSQWQQERFLGHELITINYKGANRLTVTGWMKLETDRSSNLPHHSRVPSELMLIVNQPGRLAEVYAMKGQQEQMQEPALNAYYYHNDHLGTPQLMTDGDQVVVWKASYDAFGLADVSVSDVESDLRFPGQYFDGETGLHYNYYRDYDSGVGRYVQSDPIGLSGGINTYSYVLQNPIRYSDPFGLATWSCTRFNIGASVLVGAVGKIIYTCESECVNGIKTISRFDVLYMGASLGIEVDVTGSHNNEFTDNNVIPSASVFQGNYIEIGVGGAFGIGYSSGIASINGGSKRGGVSGRLTGPAAGVGFGAAELGGTSKLVWERQVDCDGKCE